MGVRGKWQRGNRQRGNWRGAIFRGAIDTESPHYKYCRTTSTTVLQVLPYFSLLCRTTVDRGAICGRGKWKRGKWRGPGGGGQLAKRGKYCHTTSTAVLQVLPYYKYCCTTSTALLQVLPYYKYCGTTSTAVLQVLPYYKKCRTTSTAVLQRSGSVAVRNGSVEVAIIAIILRKMKSPINYVMDPSTAVPQVLPYHKYCRKYYKYCLTTRNAMLQVLLYYSVAVA
jgi:hypothetical protein